MRLLEWLMKSNRKWIRNSTLLLMTISSLSLIAGCVHPQPPIPNPTSFCEVFEPIYFNREETINWLVANDSQFIKDVLAMNETYEKLCAVAPKIDRQLEVNT